MIANATSLAHFCLISSCLLRFVPNIFRSKNVIDSGCLINRSPIPVGKMLEETCGYACNHHLTYSLSVEPLYAYLKMLSTLSLSIGFPRLHFVRKLAIDESRMLANDVLEEFVTIEAFDDLDGIILRL